MFQLSAAAAGDHGNRNPVTDCLGQFQVKAIPASICIHRGQQNLSCSQFLAPFRPFQSIQSRIFSSAMDHHTKDAIFISSGINGCYHTLTSKDFCRISNKLRVLYRRRVYRNLVCACPKDFPEIVHCADSSAYSKGNKHMPGSFPDHIGHGLSSFMSSGNIQKADFICSLFVIFYSALHWVSYFFYPHKVYTFYYFSVPDIQAGNDSFGQHQNSPAFSMASFRLIAPE